MQSVKYFSNYKNEQYTTHLFIFLVFIIINVYSFFYFGDIYTIHSMKIHSYRGDEPGDKMNTASAPHRHLSDNLHGNHTPVIHLYMLQHHA